jgi:hypothetical protein
MGAGSEGRDLTSVSSLFFNKSKPKKKEIHNKFYV